MEPSYITSSDHLKHPFSLTCQRCDAGAEIDTPEQAIAEGWREIEDISSFNFVEAYYMGGLPGARMTSDGRCVRSLSALDHSVRGIFVADEPAEELFCTF